MRVGGRSAEVDQVTLPSRLREGLGVGMSENMPGWTPRDPTRARELRNNATFAERLLWRYLQRNQTGAKFSRQMQVGKLYLDFLCRELKLVIECDGISHDRAPEKDVRRDAWLRGQGYTVLRFTNADVLGNVEGVVAAIKLEVERLRHEQAHPRPLPQAGGEKKE